MTPEEQEKARGLLASVKTEDRLRGVRLAARHSDDDAQALLLKALGDRSNFVATHAAQALAECAGPALLPKMLAHFMTLSEAGGKRDPGCHIRAHLAFAFGRLDVMQAVDALRVGIKTRQMEYIGGPPATDTAVHLRANCAQSLGQIRAPGALLDIALLLFDRGGTALLPPSQALFLTVEARKAAAQALSRLADPAGVVPLAIKLAHPDEEAPEVLQECMQALVDLEDERAVDILRPYLEHDDQALAAYAALMIARTRDPQAAALIRELIDRLSGDALQAVILALSSLRTEEAQAALKELAHHSRKDVQRLLRELGLVDLEA